MEWISLAPAGQVVPSDVEELGRLLERHLTALRATESANGGLQRVDLAAVITPAVRRLQDGVAGRRPTFARKEVDFVVPPLRAAVSVQAGRAWTNNGALTAVLAAASTEGVDWLLLLVPTTYKGGPQHANVRKQLVELSAARGVHLDLQGIGLLGY